MRRALRLLRQNPAFTILVISILALTIGACTSIFTLVNAILLKPLPFEDSSRLLVVTAVAKGDEASLGCLTWPRFNQIAGQNRTFAGFAAFTSDTLNLSGTGEPEQLQAARVSWNFFEVLGIRPVLGRTFRALDGTASGEPVVLISDSLWSRKFASAPGVVGQTINLGTRAYTVAGVLPPGFSFGLLPSRVEVWVPRIDELSLMSSEHLRSGVCYLNAVARRAAGVPSNGPSSEMAVLAAQYAHAYAKLPDAHHVVKVEPLQQEMSGGFRPILLVLAGAVALVLLIGCANVSSLLLARALARRQEIAVRRALGATSADLIRMSLFESLAIALTGGALGTMLSFLTVRLAAARLAQFLPRSEELATGINGAVLVFALSVSLLTGLLFGLAPALQFSRMAGRGTVGSRQGNRIRNLLVTAQLALSVVLLVCAGLLMRTFIHLVTLPPGFQPGHTLTMTLAVSPATYSTGAQLVNFYEQVLDRIRPLPGVQAVAASSALPVNPARASPVLVQGQAQLPLAERPIVYVQTFLHDYLRALGIPLLRGRAFDAHDRQDSPPVVMINQAFAHQFFPGQNAIGRHVWLGRSTRSAEIVGILADIKNVTLSVPAAPEIDLPFAQLPWPSMNITVRSSASAGALANAIRQQIAAVDPTQPVTNLQTLDDVLASARSQPRVMMILLGAFAAAAFLLALVGLYGVMNYSVGQRYQEMAVRMALGAGTQNLIRLIVGQGLALASIGAAIGLAASFAVTRLLATLLYGVTPTDALTFFGSPLLLLLFAAIASGIPALRAARVDPAEALRNTP